MSSQIRSNGRGRRHLEQYGTTNPNASTSSAWQNGRATNGDWRLHNDDDRRHSARRRSRSPDTLDDRKKRHAGERVSREQETRKANDDRSRDDGRWARHGAHDARLSAASNRPDEQVEEGEILSRTIPSAFDDLDGIDYDIDVDDEETRGIEERRKQRQAILLRHREEGLEAQHEQSDKISNHDDHSSSDIPCSPSQANSVGIVDDRAPTKTFALGKLGGDDANALPNAQSAAATEHEMPAAEYDPGMDRALDGERGAILLQADASGKDASCEGTNSEYEDVEVTDDEDIDDIFAIDEEATKKRKIIRRKKATTKEAVDLNNTISAPERAEVATLLDNWDDPDGYYRVTLGERLGDHGRYHVFAVLGRGMFSSVVKARDTVENDREVAIKVVRSQETMYKAGLKEIAVLKRLAALDAEDKRHLIRLVAHFEHRKHLCMVFESLSMNLREVVKRFGKNVGLNLQAVRAYAHQMFLGLALMKKAEVMHADLKPDNILVNENKTVIKICDLGSASNLTEMEITPYLVSRFYRAPEIILGQPYDCAIDMWSIGCTLYELYSGRILFPGKSNNHMLQLMQELKGKFTTKQIRKGRFSGMHFDDTNAFVVRSGNSVAGTDVVRKIQTFNPAAAGTDLRARLIPPEASKTLSASELRLTTNLLDLLSRALELDPARRLTPIQALQHSFFSK